MVATPTTPTTTIAMERHSPFRALYNRTQTTGHTHSADMHKATSPQSLSSIELERLATKLTLSSRALQSQILTLHHELAVTRRELALSRQDLDESLVRLQEIDEYMREVQDELADDTCQLSRDDVRSREEQLEELYEERDEEVSLLEHVRVIIELRESSQSKLQIVIAKLVRELCCVKRKEQLLVMLALRSRLVTLVPRKFY